jgi:hypothetical protein
MFTQGVFLIKAKNFFTGIGISLVTFALLVYNNESQIFHNVIFSFTGLLIMGLSYRFLK